ncbi:type VII secretion protein EccCa [Mycobacterium sp. Marseille-P9652]|uniref:type VII secretion protein EccCa n=1 Tax=Mycobacterium sp. Marseille-P9652 TaxID=2654950 RepID=UPI0012E6FCFC|nr:type VII secretion protein EccCa [Mycobacterium sp. Marseille-P9652]
MTQGLVPGASAAEIVLEAPPSPDSPRALIRLLPVVMTVAAMGVMAAAWFSGSAMTRSPTFLAFPAVTVASMVGALVAGRRGRPGGVDGDRAEYLDYLDRLRLTVTEATAAQSDSLYHRDPDPDTLWALTGGPRMWERRATEPDFCRARVGVGPRPLFPRLVAPADLPADPVTVAAVRRFLDAHSTIVGPVTMDLRGAAVVTVEGGAAEVRALLCAVICQLAVLHPPDQVLIAGAIAGRNRAEWDWLKWLPHNQHPVDSDAAGPARMVYPSLAEARAALTGVGPAHVVLLADLDDRTERVCGATILEVRASGAPLTITRDGELVEVPDPDLLDVPSALACARRLAGHRARAAAGDLRWPTLVGLGDLSLFDPPALWAAGRLRVPIGTTADGATVELDIREPADGGMGPHGLCIGATGSGKSELLRAIALGMITRHSPEALNLLLVDFKGGATFLDFARAPHVAAVITNLADEAPLVARMRDALAGEIERRQELLRRARHGSAAAYQRARRAGNGLAALPTLLIIVDEFSEMLSRHPDFADTFVAIGRLGRSLGMHLLLASQRLDEGRLRGLEAHLSYRMCLKTLSAADSRTVLGTLDAYELPNAPGAGFLRLGGRELIRFQAAFVSGPMPADPPPSDCADPADPVARPFSTLPCGTVTRAREADRRSDRSLADAVLDRLSGHGPPAHRVWLPPLGPSPALRELLDGATLGGLTVPIGVVDRPRQQRRTPLLVELSGAAGNVAVVGAPRSGKSTVLLTLITALAATHDAGRVQFYCLDFGGGVLRSLCEVPHVGAVAGRAEPRLVARTIAEIESLLRDREALFSDRGIGSIDSYRREFGQTRAGDPFGDVFLVIDGWAGLRHDFPVHEASIGAIAAQGLSFGIHVVLSASRWAEVRPSLKDQIGTRIELRLGDPADSDIDRKRAQEVPPDRPGRGLSRDGHHMVIAWPAEGLPFGARAAPPIPLLPAHVDHDDVVNLAGAHADTRILLGLEERRLRPVAIDFERTPHLLILGDNECGKSATLRALCREVVRTKTAAQARLIIVDFRRSLLGTVETEHLGGYAASPPALEALLPAVLDTLRRRLPPPDADQAQLRARSWWSGPDLYLLVDDHDLVAAGSNPLAALTEFLPHARDVGLHVVVASRAGESERALYEPLLAALRDLGCAALTMSCRSDGHVPFGAARPARLPPGRGVLRTRPGDEQVVQVGWSPP